MPVKWKMFLLLPGILVAFCFGVGGCAVAGKDLSVFRPAPAAALDSRLVAANTRFAGKLFGELARRDPGKNIFISPASVAMALAMTYNGADGETKQAMAKTLALQGMNEEEVNRAYAALRTILENPDPKVRLTVANSLWARKETPFNKEFLEINKKYYGAQVSALDFDDPAAPARINAWVSKKTRGKIGNLVDKIEKDDILFLINAVCFEGKWAVAFDPAKTIERPFTLGDGRQKRHPLMFQSGEFRYYRGDRFQAVSLPYGKGRISMYVFLPDPGSSLEEFYAGLNAAGWEKWRAGFSLRKGDLFLPRFKLEYEQTLNDALKALGMEVALDESRADFRKMCPVPPIVWIDEVKHKTFVEVNEEGTKAAAATSVRIKQAVIEDKFSLVVDRPFFFAICDDQTGTILFMGSVVDPEC